MYFIENNQAEDSAYTWDRAQTEIGIRIMLFGYQGYLMLNPVQQLIILINEGQIKLYSLLYAYVGKALCHTFTVAFPGDILSYLRQVVLMIGVLDMGQEFSPFVDQMHPAAHEVPG